MSRHPKYMTCKKRIESLILEENYSIGERIPSISTLIKTLDMARTNVQKALDLLCDENILQKKPGSGCYLLNLPEKTSSAPLPSIDEHLDYLSGPMGFGTNNTLRYGILYELNNQPRLWNEISTAYEQDTGTKLELVAIESIDDLLVPEKTPDVFQIPHYLLPDFVEKRLLHTLFDLDVVFDPSKFIPHASSLITHADNQWGIPAICSCSCLFTNNQESAIQDAVDTSKDLQTLMTKFQSLSLSPLADKYEAITKNCYLLTDFIELTTPKKFEYFTNFIDSLDSDEVDTFFEWFEPFFRNKKIFHELNTSCFSSVFDVFLSQKIPTILGNTSILDRLLSSSSFEIGTHPLPMGDEGYSEMTSFINVVSSKTSNLDRCADLLRHLAEYNIQKKLAMNGRLVANQKALCELHVKELDTRSTQNLIDALSHSRGIMLDHGYYGRFISQSLIPTATLWQRDKLDWPTARKKLQNDFKHLTSEINEERS